LWRYEAEDPPCPLSPCRAVGQGGAGV
jgi:hypothetical protein